MAALSRSRTSWPCDIVATLQLWRQVTSEWRRQWRITATQFQQLQVRCPHNDVIGCERYVEPITADLMTGQTDITQTDGRCGLCVGGK